MRILRQRVGFQADHSSSSYLFYAADGPVSAAGRRIAHRYSSRAEVDDHTARYQKWGDYDLDPAAYKALLGEHYDVMASESYDWWTMMIAVPKTPATQALLAPFADARGYDDQGVDVEDYGRRLVVAVYCMFDYSGPLFGYEEDHLEELTHLLVSIRQEILQGNVSFLQAVVSFYGAEGHEESEEEGPATLSLVSRTPPRDDRSKAELQRECTAHGITFRKSWTKDQLRDALAAVGGTAPSSRAVRRGGPTKLSKAARKIVASLDRV